MLFHAVVISVLFIRTYNPTPANRRGIIAVEYIQPVRHEPEEHAHGKGPRKRPAFRPPQPESAPPLPATADVVQSAETDAYILAVLTLIHQLKVYPPESIDRGEEGRVVVGVSVGRGGAILDARIEEPSPFTRLNNAALTAVTNVKTFPPLPPGVTGPIHLHIPLVYRVESH